jgi:hypothetical protein
MRRWLLPYCVIVKACWHRAVGGLPKHLWRWQPDATQSVNASNGFVRTAVRCAACGFEPTSSTMLQSLGSGACCLGMSRNSRQESGSARATESFVWALDTCRPGAWTLR